MSVFCVKCGTKNDDDSLFCRNCGEKLKKDPENGSNAKSRPKYDVFISHSSKNKNIADAICANFEQHKIKCWYAPRDIRAGESWPAAIKHGIEEAEILVLVFSENANESRQVINEVSIAYNCGKTIIPFKIADTPMNDDFDYFLNRVHWLDAMTQPMEESIDAMRKYAENILGYTYSTYEEEASAADEVSAVEETSAVEEASAADEPSVVEEACAAEEVLAADETIANNEASPVDEPETAADVAEVVAGEPETVVSEPEPVDSKPETVTTDPEVIEAESDSAVAADAAWIVESAVETVPDYASASVPVSEPVAPSEPVAASEPVTPSEPAAKTEPTATSEPVTQSEPVATSEPSDKSVDYGNCSECGAKLTKKGDNLCPECRRKKNLEKMPVTRSLDGKKSADKEEIPDQKKAENKKKTSDKKEIILAAVAGFVILLILFAPTKSRKAKSYYNDGKYEQALELYKELGDQEGIYNATFSLGKEAQNQLDLDKALEYFEQINEYPDAQKEILSTKHLKGIFLKDSGDYDSAIEILSDLGDYSVAKLDLVEAKFLKAQELMNAEDYDGAITLFSELADGEFAETKIGESDYSADVLLSYCKFKKAEGMADTYPDAAIKLLSGLGTYQPHDGLLNAKQLIYKCNYEKADNYLNNGDYLKAIQLFEELYSQKSNTVSELQAKIPPLLKTAKYSYVEEHCNTTDKFTRKYLDELSATGYGDSVKKWASLYGWVTDAIIEDYGNPNSDIVYRITKIGDAHVVVFTSGDLKNPKGLRCRIKGTDPEGTTLVSKVYKDGEQVGDPLEFEIKIKDDNSWEAAIKWTAPEYWTGTHTATWKFFDAEGHYMAEVSAKVINDDN